MRDAGAVHDGKQSFHATVVLRLIWKTCLIVRVKQALTKRSKPISRIDQYPKNVAASVTRTEDWG